MGVAGNSQGQDYFGRVARLTSEVEAARLELQSAEQARDSYRKELAGEEPIFLPDSTDPTSARTPTDVDARIEALKRDLDSLLRKYTPQHPDVVATERLIQQLDDQRKAEIEARRKAAAKEKRGPAVLDQNPVYQQLKISLADAEASVASSKAKLAGLEAQRRVLSAQAERIPQAESEFTQLVRDYDVQKRMYESLLARRESAAIGKDVQDTGGARFRIIDPPRVSPQPVAPNRLALLGLAFVFSLGAGLFASLGASQLLPTFHEARALREVSKRPILGMVSMLPSEALYRIRRRNSWLFASGLGGLIAALGAVFAFAFVVGRVV